MVRHWGRTAIRWWYKQQWKTPPTSNFFYIRTSGKRCIVEALSRRTNKDQAILCRRDWAEGCWTSPFVPQCPSLRNGVAPQLLHQSIRIRQSPLSSYGRVSANGSVKSDMCSVDLRCHCPIHISLPSRKPTRKGRWARRNDRRKKADEKTSARWNCAP